MSSSIMKKEQLLLFLEQARTSLLNFANNPSDPFVKNLCGPVCIYQETIEGKTYRVFGVDQTKQSAINFAELKQAIAKEIGLQANTNYVQIIGDCSVYSQQGTALAERYLAKLNPVETNSIVLYGFTGNKENKGEQQLLDVNQLVNEWIITQQINSERIIANIVDYHTPLAIKEWNCSFSSEVNNFYLVYTQNEPHAKFGDDVISSDNLSDSMICFDGGIQAILQLCNGKKNRLPLYLIDNLRDLTDAKNLDPTTHLPYLSAAEFLLYIIDEATSDINPSKEKIEDIINQYLLTHSLYNLARNDAETKGNLWQQAINLLINEELWKKLPLSLKSDGQKLKISPALSNSIFASRHGIESHDSLATPTVYPEFSKTN